MGAVQHYFATRDQMLLFALDYGNIVIATRARSWSPSVGRPPREAFRWFFSLYCRWIPTAAQAPGCGPR